MSDWLKAVNKTTHIYGNTIASSSSTEVLTQFYKACLEEIIKILNEPGNKECIKQIFTNKDYFSELIKQAVGEVKTRPPFSSLSADAISKIQNSLYRNIELQIKNMPNFDFKNISNRLSLVTETADDIIEKIFKNRTTMDVVNEMRVVKKPPIGTSAATLESAAAEVITAEFSATQAAVNKGLTQRILGNISRFFVRVSKGGKNFVFTWGGPALVAATSIIVFGEGSKDAISGEKDYVSFNNTPPKYRKLFDEEQHIKGQNLHSYLEQKFPKKTYSFKGYQMYVYTMFATQTENFPDLVVNNMVGIYIRLIKKNHSKPLLFTLGEFIDAYIGYYASSKKLGINKNKYTFEKLLEIYISLPQNTLNDIQKMPFQNKLTTILIKITNNIKAYGKFDQKTFVKSIEDMKAKEALWPQWRK